MKTFANHANPGDEQVGSITCSAREARAVKLDVIENNGPGYPPKRGEMSDDEAHDRDT